MASCSQTGIYYYDLLISVAFGVLCGVGSLWVTGVKMCNGLSLHRILARSLFPAMSL